MLRPTVNCNQDCTFCSANETSSNVWASREEMLRAIARTARRGIERGLLFLTGARGGYTFGRQARAEGRPRRDEARDVERERCAVVRGGAQHFFAPRAGAGAWRACVAGPCGGTLVVCVDVDDLFAGRLVLLHRLSVAGLCLARIRVDLFERELDLQFGCTFARLVCIFT